MSVRRAGFAAGFAAEPAVFEYRMFGPSHFPWRSMINQADIGFATQ
jgi:hypothetical protein